MPQQIHALESTTLLPHCTGLIWPANLIFIFFLSLCFLLLPLAFHKARQTRQTGKTRHHTKSLASQSSWFQPCLGSRSGGFSASLNGGGSQKQCNLKLKEAKYSSKRNTHLNPMPGDSSTTLVRGGLALA